MRRVLQIVFAVALFVAVWPQGASAAGRCGDPALRSWCDTSLSPDRRAGLLLGALTRDEKISLLAGDDLAGACNCFPGSHIGTSNGVPRVGLPSVYFTDGPVGVRQGTATGLPSSMTVAASFDPAVAFSHAGIVGDEARKKGNRRFAQNAVTISRSQPLEPKRLGTPTASC